MKLSPVFALIPITMVAFAVSLWEQYQPARRYREEVMHQTIALGHPHSDLYHLLPGEHCAPGYLPIPHAFSRARETWDGCWSGSHEATDFTLDFLLPGEDAAIGVVVREHR